MRQLIILLCTFFRIGNIPKASGTAASFAALFPAWLIASWFGKYTLMISALVILVVGIWATKKYLETSESKDPKEVVIDEVVGQWIALSMMPLTIHAYIIGFIAFRFFDILKPWPVSFFDKRLKNEYGVMLDDVAAGLYPAVIITALSMAGVDVMRFLNGF